VRVEAAGSVGHLEKIVLNTQKHSLMTLYSCGGSCGHHVKQTGGWLQVSLCSLACPSCESTTTLAYTLVVLDLEVPDV